MESPVRLCLGAALVVNLLLLSGTCVYGNTLPNDTTATTIKDERTTRLARVNDTSWIVRNRLRSPDVALNELNPKEIISEEHTEKNAKYKDRGRVRFGSQRKSAIQSTTSRVSPTEATKLIIVTPTPEVKKPAQIINSMRSYKKNKIAAKSSTTAPISVEIGSNSEEESEENESFEKYTSSKFHDSEFYTMPNSKENDGFDSTTKGSNNKKQDLSTPIGDISSFYSRDPYRSKDDPYKTDSFFDFTSDLTTPRNDFFDKKFKAISKSIINNLASIEKRTARSNSTNLRRVVKENIDINKTNNNTPTNKSTVIFKNTKEVRLLDNEKAGTANKELSDVQGTSIYYEMSVLSTEMYAVNHSSDDDCDDEATPTKPTTSTSPEIKDVSRNTTQSTPVTAEPLNKNESLSAAPSNYFTSSRTPDNINEESNQLSTGFPPVFSSISPFPVSAQNLYSTEKTTRLQSNSYANRQRNYSKRLNFSAVKDSPNSVTSRTENYTNQGYKQATRKFLHTTPKSKPVWMAPRANITRTFVRSTHPTTIYSEHFSIRDRNSSTPRPRQSNRTMLTTVSSDIDPVLQSDVAGVKKIVQSQSIADNSIPALWKRGSTTYSTSTTAVPQIQSSVNDLEIPPTLTAWALASLRSPPSRPAVNVTRTTQKNVDENELQKVGDVSDKKDVSSASIITTTPMNDYVSKKVIEIEQNRLPWRPVQTPPTSSSSQPVSETAAESTATESKSERLPAESNVSLTADATSTLVAQTDHDFASEVTTTSISSESVAPITTISSNSKDKSTNDTIPPVDATKSTGFESITKFPAGVTTPQNDIGANPIQNKSSTTLNDKKPSKDEYEITTIRFSYVPIIDMTEKTLEDSTTLRQVPPTRTKTTSAEDVPITTYRPSYTFTTDTSEETTITETERPTSQESSPETELTSTEELTSASNDIETTSSQSAEDRTTTIETKTDASTETESSETTSFSTEGSDTPPSAIREPSVSSEANSGSNEVITQQTTKMTAATIATSSEVVTSPEPVDTTKVDTVSPTTEAKTTEEVSEENEKIAETTSVEDSKETTAESATDSSTRSEETDELSNEVDDVTTEASSRVVTEEAGSGAAIAIAVSTIGVIALILLVGLLLVVRRRSRRGVYAQRCTPVSLDAYSLDSVSVGHRKGNHRFRTSKRSYGNPAYDDEVTSHPMQYAALANFALDVESITAEFAEIPTVTVRPDEVPPGCEDKNRYSNVLPLPETRVPLKRIGNDPTTEYINANYVTGPGNIRNYYILCQAPLANTVVDFWRMIWEQNSRLVVMLTEYMENGVEKCYEYLPPSEVSDNKRTFGDFQIILKKREQKDKYAISSVQLINMATQTWREVTHLWYFWPAKGVPEDYDSVIDFLGEMRNYMKISQNAKEYDEEGVEVIYSERSSKLWALRAEGGGAGGGGPHVYSPARAEDALRRGNGTLARMKAASEIDGVRPCVMTCASGAGRAGVLAAADVCARAAPDVPRAVRALRAQRPHALHNRQHYIFLYKLLSEYGKKMMGAGVDTI